MVLPSAHTAEAVPTQALMEDLLPVAWTIFQTATNNRHDVRM